MLRITQLSGEELTCLPLTELSDVKALKQRLHEQHGLPPRFRQTLLHEGNTLDDAVKLETEMDLQLLIVAFSEPSGDQGRELRAAAWGDRLAEVEALLQLPMDPDAPDEDGAGADKNWRNIGGGFALLAAADFGHAPVVQLLLEAGAQKDLRDRRGITALMCAASCGHAPIVQLLLQAGADVDACGVAGDTALIFAARHGHAPIVQLLLQAGCQLNARNNGDKTALMQALLEAGCQVDGCPDCSGYAEVVWLLLRARCQLDTSDNRVNTALMDAASEDEHTALVRFLLEAHASTQKGGGKAGKGKAKGKGKGKGKDDSTAKAKGKGKSKQTFAVTDKGQGKGKKGKEKGRGKGKGGEKESWQDRGRGKGYAPSGSALREHRCLRSRDSRGSVPCIAATPPRKSYIAARNLGCKAPFRASPRNRQGACGLHPLDKRVATKRVAPKGEVKGGTGFHASASIDASVLLLFFFLLAAHLGSGLLENAPQITALSPKFTSRHPFQAPPSHEPCTAPPRTSLAPCLCGLAMLSITLLSGEELTCLPLTELSDVKALKQRLHEQHGLPPRFRQRLFHEGNTLDDAVQLDTAMDVQILIVAFIENWEEEGPELCEAAASDRVDQAEELLQLPMHPDASRDDEGMTPLMRASLFGHVDVAELLLEAGAETDVSDNNGCTALMCAARNGHASVVQLLLNAGAEKDLRDSLGLTALISAAECDHALVVQLLLDAGAEMDAGDIEGHTALMKAARRCHAASVRLLLEAGAEKDLCNVEGRTALMMASEPKIRRLLEPTT
eukprot:s2440_g12.t1